jgi:hypothetical protein
MRQFFIGMVIRTLCPVIQSIRKPDPAASVGVDVRPIGSGGKRPRADTSPGITETGRLTFSGEC